jgi:Anaerobic dehydrogenases, typically selenocysteine-containing
MRMTTASTCCYCGVGCGVLIEHDGERILDVAGDPSHPANFGKLCSKGSTLHLTGDLDARALYPELRLGKGLAAAAPTGTVPWSMRPAYSPRPSANTGRTASPSMSPASC